MILFSTESNWDADCIRLIYMRSMIRQQRLEEEVRLMEEERRRLARWLQGVGMVPAGGHLFREHPADMMMN